MYEVTEINHISALNGLREQWNELLAETKGATFFQTLEWLEAYWKHFGARKRLQVLLVGPASRPVGILPLVVHREQRKVGTVRLLTYPLDDWGSYYGPIGAQPYETLLAGLQYVHQNKKRWDLLDIRFVPQGSRDTASTAEIMKLTDFEARSSVRDETSIIDMAGGWDEYLTTRTSKWRNNFRRWTRRLNELGQVRYVRHRPEAGSDDYRWDLYEECERIASLSWQGSSDDGTTLSSAGIRDFLRDAHTAATRLGCLDVNLLRLNEQYVAFAYNYSYRGQVYGLRIGYDPELSRFSLGNLLYAYTIKDSYARGDDLYDMGTGSLHIKRHLRSRVEPVMQHTYYNPRSIRSRLLKWKGRFDDRRQNEQATDKSTTGEPSHVAY